MRAVQIGDLQLGMDGDVGVDELLILTPHSVGERGSVALVIAIEVAVTVPLRGDLSVLRRHGDEVAVIIQLSGGENVAALIGMKEDQLVLQYSPYRIHYSVVATTGGCLINGQSTHPGMDLIIQSLFQPLDLDFSGRLEHGRRHLARARFQQRQSLILGLIREAVKSHKGGDGTLTLLSRVGTPGWQRLIRRCVVLGLLSAELGHHAISGTH